MRKIHLLVSILLTSLMVVGCSSESYEDLNVGSKPQINRNDEVTLEEAKNSPVQAEASRYYKLLKTAILATNSHLPSTRVNAHDNPFVELLENLEFVSEDKTRTTSNFYEQEEKRQVQFLAGWAQIEAKELNDKMAEATTLVEAVEEQNELLEETLKEESVVTRSGKLQVKDNDRFFRRLREKYEAAYAGEVSEDAVADEPQSRGISVSVTPGPILDSSIMRRALHEHAEVGDIILALPKFEKAWIIYNKQDNVYTKGHSAIIHRIPTAAEVEYADPDESFTFGSLRGQGGIQYEPHKIWTMKSYVLGLQNVKWEVNWKNIFKLKSVFKKVKTKLDNPAQFLAGSLQYEWVDYVKWYEYFTAKWAAPKRFTCTTVLWYVAKHEFNFDLSFKLSPLVTPSAIFLSEHTYVKAKITD